MRKRIGALVLAAMAVGMVGTAYADGEGGSATVTATITAGAVGSRSVTSVTPVVMQSSANAATLGGTVGVVVAEAARTGTNPWSVTMSSTTLTNTVAGSTITADQLAVSGRGITQVAGGGSSEATAGSQSLDAARTMFSVTGQSTTIAYTGTYTSTGTLTLAVPNGTPVGVYAGTLTVTLVQ